MKLKTVLKTILFFLFSLVVLGGYFYAAFLAGGYGIFAGARGNDSWAYISRLKLLADYFPKIPFWNNLEGAGISLSHSYPNLTHFLIIITSKLTNLSIPESFKLWGFLGVTLFAFGVFVFGWSRLRVVVAAFLAGIFVLLSPISWIWWFEWGFVAEVIAAMFFPYTILFFDLFMLSAQNAENAEGAENAPLRRGYVRGAARYRFKIRFYFVMAVVFMTLSFLAHPAIFVAEVCLMIIYIPLLAIFRKKGKLKALFTSAKYGVLLYLCFLLLSLFWMLPFNRYQKLAGQSKSQALPTVGSYKQDIVPLEYVLSFDRPQVMEKNEYFQKYGELKPRDKIEHKNDKEIVVQRFVDRANFSFPYAVSLLYFLGLATGFIFWKRKSIPLFLTSAVGLLIVTSPLALFLISKLPGPLKMLTSTRSLIYTSRLLLSVVAGFGAYGLFALLFYPFRFIDKYFILRFFKKAFLTLAALSLTFLVLYKFRSKPEGLFFDANYGKAAKINLQDFWGEERGVYCSLEQYQDKLQCQSEKLNLHFKGHMIVKLCLEIKAKKTAILPAVCQDNFTDEDVDQLVKECDFGKPSGAAQVLCQARHELWPELYKDLSFKKIVSKLKRFPQKEFSLEENKDYFALIPDNLFFRYDTSPSETDMCQQGPYAKQTPQMSLYGANLSLINRLYGYQISNFYTGDKVYKDPAALPEIAQWFGIKNIILRGKFDEENRYFEKLSQAGFENVNALEGQENKRASLLELPQGEPIAAVADKPKILVIGSEARRAYETIFIKAHFGLVSYMEAFLIHGKEKVDDYTLEQLLNYDILFLHGYQYKSAEKAWRLLGQYLAQGGRLFIETGWEKVAADWEREKTADFFPTSSLEWTNFGKAADFQLHKGVIDIGEIDAAGFEPLVWKDDPWKVSTSDVLRNWAKPILTVRSGSDSKREHPLVAGGQYGEGRVIWSGMNIVSHIPVFDHTHPEMVLAGRLIDWLLEGKKAVNFQFEKDFAGKRDNPDRVEFTFNRDIGEGASLYFKEAYYPYWKSELATSHQSPASSKKLEIEKAGAEMMFVQLPDIQAGDKVEFRIVRPFSDYLAYVISGLTFIGLVVYLIKPGIFEFKGFKKFKMLKGFKGFNLKKQLSWIREGEEENY